MDEVVVDAGGSAVIDTGGQISRGVKLLPFGDPFYGRDGRGPYILRDRAQAERILTLTRQVLGSAAMMIDYDHASELAAPVGKGRALAAGWVRELLAREDGIWAVVDWTPQAESELGSRQYRYISPNFRVHKTTREVTRIVNAALTNTPNLDLPALASFGRGVEMAQATAEERAICAAVGVNVSDFIAQKEARREEAASNIRMPAGPGMGRITAEEAAICAKLGVSETAFLATRDRR